MKSSDKRKLKQLMSMVQGNGFYTAEDIQKKDALYNLIVGERSNGKTTYVLAEMLARWVVLGEKGAYIRRYDDEVKPAMVRRVWATIVDELDLVNKFTDGEYQGIAVHSGEVYLTKYDPQLDKNIKQGEPFCHVFALNIAEKYKSQSFPFVQTIMFDEFISRKREIRDEFVEFTNLISTIIRSRDNVKIYMLANTVSKYSSYFTEMGLDNIATLKQGTIAVYEGYRDNANLRVAVEYCESSQKTKGGKKSDKYFAFGNQKLNMITGGGWELPMYPHAPFKIQDSNILGEFFMLFDNKILQGDVVLQDDSLFAFIHEKTTPLKGEDDLIFSLEFNPRHNYAINPLGPYRNKVAEKVGYLFKHNQVYFSTNDVGEMVRAYINKANSMNSFNL